MFFCSQLASDVIVKRLIFKHLERQKTHRYIGLTRPVVEQLENDDRFVVRRLENWSAEDRCKPVGIGLRDPDVASAVRKLCHVRVHSKLELRTRVAIQFILKMEQKVNVIFQTLTMFLTYKRPSIIDPVNWQTFQSFLRSTIHWAK